MLAEAAAYVMLRPFKDDVPAHQVGRRIRARARAPTRPARTSTQVPDHRPAALLGDPSAGWSACAQFCGVADGGAAAGGDTLEISHRWHGPLLRGKIPVRRAHTLFVPRHSVHRLDAGLRKVQGSRLGCGTRVQRVAWDGVECSGLYGSAGGCRWGTWTPGIRSGGIQTSSMASRLSIEAPGPGAWSCARRMS